MSYSTLQVRQEESICFIRIDRPRAGNTIATGPHVTIPHVRGKTNAGGIGFLAASDIVLADETARFSLQRHE